MRRRRIQRRTRHDRHAAAVIANEIFAEFGQQLPGRRNIRVERAIEENDVHDQPKSVVSFAIT